MAIREGFGTVLRRSRNEIRITWLDTEANTRWEHTRELANGEVERSHLRASGTEHVDAKVTNSPGHQ